MFEYIKQFENQLAKFTGAPYVVTTDCCTHAVELCLLYDKVTSCKFSCYTYLSIPQTMNKLNIKFDLLEEMWVGEYKFHNTRIWDSARRLEPNMYKEGQFQCLSFGYTKPIDIGRGGAILLDSKNDYEILSMMRYDGRDINIKPWESQQTFIQGYHYKLNPEECIRGISALKKYKLQKQYAPKIIKYPDCRGVLFK